MNEQLNHFITAIKLDKKYINKFQNYQLTNIKYKSKTKNYECDLEGINILPFDCYIHLHQKITSLRHSVIINVKASNGIDYDNDIIEQYFRHALETTKLGNYSLAFLKSSPLEVSKDSKEIIVNCSSESELAAFNNFSPQLNLEIVKFGLDYKIVAKLGMNENKKDEMIEEFDMIKICDISEARKKVKFKGYIFNIIIPENSRNESGKIFDFYITDNTDSIIVRAKCFNNDINYDRYRELTINQWVEVTGTVGQNSYMGMIVYPNEIETLAVTARADNAPIKRVELHLHTKMSTMDGINNITDYVKEAARWGHKAIALTDHENIQSYPEAQAAAKATNIKIIYGVEMNMVENKYNIVSNPQEGVLSQASYVFFDFETTGLSSRYDKIIEFGAVKYENGIKVDVIDILINPETEISKFTTELTGITSEMLIGKPTISEALEAIKKFIADAILVAHNASFDIAFLEKALGYKIKNTIIDTLPLARFLYREDKSHTLGALARKYKISYDEISAHRADYDADILQRVFEKMLLDLENDYEIKKIDELFSINNDNCYLKERAKHVNVLVKNKYGLKNLFELITLSNIKYLAKEAKIPRYEIEQRRQNLLIGSSCLNGEIFEIASTKSKDDLEAKIEFYDYIEIQPPSNYTHLVDTNRFKSLDEIKMILLDIIDSAKKLGKIIVATGDVHYLSEQEKRGRDVYINSPRIGGVRHPLFDYKNRIKETPAQHLRTTEEMLSEFSFLNDDELAYEIVVTNTNKIADKIEVIEPIHDKLYTPHIDGADEKLAEICYQNAHNKYGKVLPEIVASRLEKELSNIKKHKFSVIYYIAHKLVNKSLIDGYLVGSRGSVGSSFVATMSSITEVNPLPPHYICPKCQYSEFTNDRTYKSGIDLPHKKCPKCKTCLIGEGQDIPFETFLGINADKVPDIDLNFSGDYQERAHAYTKELFGEDKVYRAGTISTVASKTAYGYVNTYLEKNGVPNKAEVERLVKITEGAKRTTGQHPGGIIVIPSGMDVHDFTPVQFPADEISSAWKTTHFDFHAIHDNVLKLDILGHQDPTVLKMLHELTNIDPKDVPLNDSSVLRLFSSTESLNVGDTDILNMVGTTGIPEFGTAFVKKMIEETKPKTFAELVQLSGLSHGTDVWLGNAKELISKQKLALMDVIGCRDDIMVYLMYNGLDDVTAFKIMEDVRKGKGVKAEYEKIMLNNDIPKWYIDSCNKIKYMFPKAHAVAYVMMALRIAWFKIYQPLAYYASYFTIRCSQFDLIAMTKGYSAMFTRVKDIKYRMSSYEHKKNVTNKEVEIFNTLELGVEFSARGFNFTNVSLDKSHATKFIIDKETNSLIPPFIIIDGLGINIAESIVNARTQSEFISQEDLAKRTLITTTQLENFRRLGIVEHLNKSNQMSLFSF